MPAMGCSQTNPCLTELCQPPDAVGDCRRCLEIADQDDRILTFEGTLPLETGSHDGTPKGGNIDPKTVSAFGDEWSDFDQTGMTTEEHARIFSMYFKIFPWDRLSPSATGFDMGCGSGRWAMLVAKRVGHLHCIDASGAALDVARTRMKDYENVTFHHASVDGMPMADASQDFGFSLGVLHHIPDTALALESCVKKLKSGAPFLVYLYYRFDNKPRYFQLLWQASDVIRKMICRLPFWCRRLVTDVLATTIYWPLARLAAVAETLGANVQHWPLSAYRNVSFYTMRTDARDRFGTPLEQRFTKIEIEAMMTKAGLGNISFHDDVPYWVAVGYRAT
jgi:SAM-dependent methyltransferase